MNYSDGTPAAVGDYVFGPNLTTHEAIPGIVTLVLPNVASTVNLFIIKQVQLPPSADPSSPHLGYRVYEVAADSTKLTKLTLDELALAIPFVKLPS